MSLSPRSQHALEALREGGVEAFKKIEGSFSWGSHVGNAVTEAILNTQGAQNRLHIVQEIVDGMETAAADMDNTDVKDRHACRVESLGDMSPPKITETQPGACSEKGRQL